MLVTDANETRLIVSRFPSPFLIRNVAGAVVVLAASGCSLLHFGGSSPTATATAPMALPAAPMASAAAVAAAPVPAPAWRPDVIRHLDAASMVGQTWTFPSAHPQTDGDNRFVFKRDRVEASNAHEHVSGTWSVDGDKLCVVLNASAQGGACYYAATTAEGALRILVLPARERLPLQIR